LRTRLKNPRAKSKKKDDDDDDEDYEEPPLNEDESVKLVVQALLEVVESGSKNIEIAVIRRDTGIEVLPNEKVVEIVKIIEEEKEKSGKGKKKKDKGKPAAEDPHALLYKSARESNK